MHKVTINYKYDDIKKERLELLCNKMPVRFSLISLLSLAMTSILELSETGKLNSFLEMVQETGKKEIK